MFISKLEVNNFRGIVSGEIPLRKFTGLIGPNNCGKTTIVEALALVLGRDRLVRNLTEHDFHGSDPRAADRILIIATVTGFATNDPANHTDWIRHGRATPKWQNTVSGAVSEIQDPATDRLACQIAFAARFDLETLEPATVRYFYDAADLADPFDEEMPVTPIPAELLRQIGFFLVPASRTWDRMLSFGSELFRRVVSYVGGRPATAVLAERTRLRNPINPLEEDPNLSQLIRDVNGDIRSLFGHDIELKLRVTTTDSEGILEAIAPHFALGNETALPAKRHGSGLISVQTLVLLVRFGQMRVARGDGFMMVIEEPELHVPPPLQRKLLHLLRTMTTQTIVTTHSPIVAAIPDAHEVSLVVNHNGALTGKPLMSGPIPADADNCLRSLFVSARDATVLALMHPVVLIPEGKFDANWLRLLVKCCELGIAANDPAQSFAHEVGVIPTVDARALDTLGHLSTVAPRIVCLFDSDQAGRDYTAAACRREIAPSAIIRWPDGWSMEHVIGWIVAADPTVLDDQTLAEAGVPPGLADFITALADRDRLKRGEIVHGLIADAILRKAACRTRVSYILRVLADIASGRQPHADAAVREERGRSVVWTVRCP